MHVLSAPWQPGTTWLDFIQPILKRTGPWSSCAPDLQFWHRLQHTPPFRGRRGRCPECHSTDDFGTQSLCFGWKLETSAWKEGELSVYYCMLCVAPSLKHNADNLTTVIKFFILYHSSFQLITLSQGTWCTQGNLSLKKQRHGVPEAC